MYEESLSYSKRYAWNSCRQKFQYQYVRKLRSLPGDMPLEVWQNFSRGNLIHGILESFLRGQSAEVGIAKTIERFEKDGMSPAARLCLPDMKTSAKLVAQAVADWLPLSDWEPLEHEGKPTIETKLQAPLPGWPGGFVGYADLIARHKPTGRCFIIDWKSRNRFDAEDVGQYDLQLATYQHCAQHMGIQVHGTALIEIKPEPPKRGPRYQRNDTGSIDSVRESSDGRMRWTPTFRSQALVDTLWADFSREAKAIARDQRNPDEIWRNTSAFGCGGCKYRRVCLAEANQEDHEWLENQTFTVSIT
jgi:hypothetical protein